MRKRIRVKRERVRIKVKSQQIKRVGGRCSAPKGFTGRTDHRINNKVIQDWANTYQAAWKSACEHDDIDPVGRFVVFSNDNPYAQFIDKAREEYYRAIQDSINFGYVGLTL